MSTDYYLEYLFLSLESQLFSWWLPLDIASPAHNHSVNCTEQDLISIHKDAEGRRKASQQLPCFCQLRARFICVCLTIWGRREFVLLPLLFQQSSSLLGHFCSPLPACLPSPTTLLFGAVWKICWCPACSFIFVHNSALGMMHWATLSPDPPIKCNHLSGDCVSKLGESLGPFCAVGWVSTKDFSEPLSNPSHASATARPTPEDMQLFPPHGCLRFLQEAMARLEAPEKLLICAVPYVDHWPVSSSGLWSVCPDHNECRVLGPEGKMLHKQTAFGDTPLHFGRPSGGIYSDSNLSTG